LIVIPATSLNIVQSHDAVKLMNQSKK